VDYNAWTWLTDGETGRDSALCLSCSKAQEYMISEEETPLVPPNDPPKSEYMISAVV
jgi:hypothetical protein